MSLPVTTTITGIDTPEVLRRALGVARGFRAMHPGQMEALRHRCQLCAVDGRLELYKLSLRFERRRERMAQEFAQMQRVETELSRMSENSADSYIEQLQSAA
jgi:hypothetical protein